MAHEPSRVNQVEKAHLATPEEGWGPVSLPNADIFHDTDWGIKVSKAKRARLDAQKARKGKPATFSTGRFAP